MSIELTARDRYYRVFHDGEEVSRHHSEREAIQGALATFARHGAPVWYTQPTVDLDAPPTQYPTPEPTPPASTTPPPEPEPGNTLVELDLRNSRPHPKHPSRVQLLDLEGYDLNAYGRGWREGFRIDEHAVWLLDEFNQPAGPRGTYFSALDRRRNFIDARPEIAACNRMSVDVYLPAQMVTAAGPVHDQAKDLPAFLAALNEGAIGWHFADYHSRPGDEILNPEDNNQHFYWQNKPAYAPADAATVLWELIDEDSGLFRYTVNITTPMQQRGKGNDYHWLEEPTRYIQTPPYGMAESLTRFYLHMLTGTSHFGPYDGIGLRTLRFWREEEDLRLFQVNGELAMDVEQGGTVQLFGVNRSKNTQAKLGRHEVPAGEPLLVPMPTGYEWITGRRIGSLDAETIRT